MLHRPFKNNHKCSKRNRSILPFITNRQNALTKRSAGTGLYLDRRGEANADNDGHVPLVSGMGQEYPLVRLMSQGLTADHQKVLRLLRLPR